MLGGGLVFHEAHVEELTRFGRRPKRLHLGRSEGPTHESLRTTQILVETPMTLGAQASPGQTRKTLLSLH